MFNVNPMHMVAMLALIEYTIFTALVGRARLRYGVRAPATTGHPIFERYFRVQQNTLELLVCFLPALWLAAYYSSPFWAATIGMVFVVARIVYFEGYVRRPEARRLGFAFSVLPIVSLLLLAATGALSAI